MMTADQDPRVDQEEKAWRKKQAGYDPEDEAQCDIPVADKVTDDDSICPSPSLKSIQRRRNVDSIVQCSLEELQIDFPDSIGAIPWLTCSIQSMEGLGPLYMVCAICSMSSMPYSCALYRQFTAISYCLNVIQKVIVTESDFRNFCTLRRSFRTIVR